MDDIGKVIKERRNSLRITQRELADLAGVSINSLTKMERGESNPSLKLLTHILDTLGLEIVINVKNKNIL